MRPDLLYSQAAIDWAVSNFPAFQQRLDTWIKTKIRLGIEELAEHIPDNLLIAGPEEPLPLSLSVEAGAYINAIRSSLDMLATALVQRHNLPIKPRDVYFPIVKDAGTFNSGQYSGYNFVNGLPDAEKKIIESLKPYGGGNEILWTLHKLDNMRKHQRLLTVLPVPTKLKLGGYEVKKHFTPVSTGYIHDGYKIILGLWSKLAPQPRIKLTAFIAIDEVGLVNKKPVVEVLNLFAEHVSSIIKMFDH